MTFTTQVKVRFTLGHAMHAQRGISFFNLSTRLGWVFNTMLLPLYLQETDLVTIVQEAGWAPGLV